MRYAQDTDTVLADITVDFKAGEKVPLSFVRLLETLNQVIIIIRDVNLKCFALLVVNCSKHCITSAFRGPLTDTSKVFLNLGKESNHDRPLY